MKFRNSRQEVSPLRKTLPVLILLLNLAQTFPAISASPNDRQSEQVKCVCDETCEHLRGKDCPFGLTFDMCQCCLVCSRGEGEPCGGALGNCAIGLHCIREDNLHERNHSSTVGKDEGRCSRDEVCGEVVDQFGCVIGPEGNCICSTRSVCPGEEMFLFDTPESCQSRMAFLIAKKDFEPASSPPPATDECAKVQCPEVEPCPTDSYRLPTAFESANNEDGGGGRSQESCCSILQPCQCITGLHCSPPECPRGSIPKIILNGTGLPGRCCPKFECSLVVSSAEDSGGDGDLLRSRGKLRSCSYSGREYGSGDTWTHPQDCTECLCHNGVVSCKPVKCDLPAECRLARSTSQSCCPVCVGCLTATGAVYNNSEVWEEDPCTTCTCNEGRIQCHAAMCQTSCSNPKHIPGECCPRCDSNGLVPEHKDHHQMSCPFLECHKKECPNGFRLDRHGCPTCKCIKCPNVVCKKSCPSGYEQDIRGCGMCECKHEELANNLLLPSKEEDDEEQVKTLSSTISSKTLGHAHCLHTSDGIFRVEGEEWSDSCRRCVCKNGMELCSLITCTPPKCEHPIFYPGDCCPKCPDEEIELSSSVNISVCQSSDGTQRLEGEMWTLSPCLQCTCHSGQVLCLAEECPPTPCAHSFMRSPTDCCLSCPEEEDEGGRRRSKGIKNAFTSDSSHSKKSICLSDDSAKSYSDGEMWKVGACQSCICQDGQINCFSAGKCPSLDCDRPVLAKNQCCPICLGRGRLDMNSVASSGSGRPSSVNAGDATVVDVIQRRTEDENEQGEESNRKEKLGDGIEPHCAIMIATLMCITLVLTLFVVRQCFFRRSSSSKSRLIKKAPPSFHSSNSSTNNHDTTPPVTPDCCYKCDYNKYSSCAQLSEQKPLFKPKSIGDSSSGGSSGHHSHNSEKV